MNTQNSYEINTKDELENFVSSNWNQINELIDQKMEKLPTPIYSSVDIREGKNKFAPVDLNIYPAGFNNLCLLDLDASSNLFRETLSDVKSIALIPESHTKNLFYLDHLAFLKKALNDAGFECLITSPDESLFDSDQKSIQLISHSKFELEIFKTQIHDSKIQVDGKTIDLAILNNDQSTPLEFPWNDISTPVIPTPKIGWFRRQKSEHFEAYESVVSEFCKEYSINPALLMASFKTIEDVDFSSKEGLDKIGEAVDSLKTGLDDETKVFVKASQGTYGMGISVVTKGEEITQMNRKNRDKMNIGKNKIKFTSVVIQEGVESILKYDDMPAEVAIYLVAGKPTGGFVRANSQRSSQENLNSRGMVFKKYCISEIKENNDFQSKEAVYSVVARLSTLAGAMEIQTVEKE